MPRVSAAAASDGAPPAVGTVGAGVGACAGVLKGGMGTASTTLPSGVTVGALVAVNSAGNVIDQATGLPWMTLPGRRVRSDDAARMSSSPRWRSSNPR